VQRLLDVTNWFYSQRDYIFPAMDGDQIVEESSDDEDDEDDAPAPTLMMNVCKGNCLP